jgi:hypothetical protein
MILIKDKQQKLLEYEMQYLMNEMQQNFSRKYSALMTTRCKLPEYTHPRMMTKSGEYFRDAGYQLHT